MKINKHETSQICSSDSSLLSCSVTAREYIKSRAVDFRVHGGRYVHLSRFHLWCESLNTLNQSGSCQWPGRARRGELTCALKLFLCGPSQAANPGPSLGGEGGGFKTGCCCCCCCCCGRLRPSRPRSIEASAGIQVLTVIDVSVSTSRLSCVVLAYYFFLSFCVSDVFIFLLL